MCCRIIDEEGTELVPEIAAENEEAADEHEIGSDVERYPISW
jgi:hypothetical protein